MLYVDYNWDLNPNSIIPDKELDTNKLGWKIGEYWKSVEVDGRLMFRKVDKLEEFILKGVDNGNS
jgi:hypothetical protein